MLPLGMLPSGMVPSGMVPSGMVPVSNLHLLLGHKLPQHLGRLVSTNNFEIHGHVYQPALGAG